MFTIKSRINLGKNSVLLRKVFKILSLKAFADESPEPVPENLPKPEDKKEDPPVFNFEQLIAQARKEEKEKALS